ncbi:MAG: repair protein RecO protein [Parcubacteria group bacterium GW2011_GWA2_43_9b]|uniref:DNA repair protein RecO n=1 Tax=Candidatus Portnoybacteria bacterium RIFCSPLOWO2_02_FULL_39_11 TaxID=1802001 RepID=A0A1G2FTW1_9BACT|nr:MAG: repair protein RecO protein [Parcubacteria group bacterium GW2011_GWA2_43_9b]OGZ41162.1 MAG: DNA repair protein RecO [Candidatus Portnoybacteria bacterium RIFCSPLOWO2_02_FULL_39_11]
MVNRQYSFSKGVGVCKTEGIILKSADWGDLDRLLTVYTRGYGKIQTRAISARKKESKLNGLLQSFTRGQFLLAKSKTIDIVTDLEVADSYFYLHSHLVNLGYAYYFSELIDKLIPSPERDDNVWRLVSRVFEVLNSPQPPLKLRGGEGELSQIKIAFEDKLLEFLGQPSLKLWLASHSKPSQYGKILSVQRLNYLQSLAGEQINSQKFLAQI